jgi:hypothetical protein
MIQCDCCEKHIDTESTSGKSKQFCLECASKLEIHLLDKLTRLVNHISNHEYNKNPDIDLNYILNELQQLISCKDLSDAQKHKKRHIYLHASLDELIADFILHNQVQLSKTTISELQEWSNRQKEEPDSIKSF